MRVFFLEEIINRGIWFLDSLLKMVTWWCLEYIRFLIRVILEVFGRRGAFGDCFSFFGINLLVRFILIKSVVGV